ncbi:hypothetical protein LX32DRAFT_245060 [Colletotrichum zoysiae]|uniref:Uncharacterized protein n=1 Tax=Colletotrichum zoysiae TaxID=1216348 RepID=A0AAD9HMV8_9PEZI|nr:hypothetical protein LX32DRAFT_245060 [Colletotrichum zoysiae]
MSRPMPCYDLGVLPAALSRSLESSIHTPSRAAAFHVPSSRVWCGMSVTGDAGSLGPARARHASQQGMVVRHVLRSPQRKPTTRRRQTCGWTCGVCFGALSLRPRDVLREPGLLVGQAPSNVVQTNRVRETSVRAGGRFWEASRCGLWSSGGRAREATNSHGGACTNPSLGCARSVAPLHKYCHTGRELKRFPCDGTRGGAGTRGLAEAPRKPTRHGTIGTSPERNGEPEAAESRVMFKQAST